jgi:hypothetical protein
MPSQKFKLEAEIIRSSGTRYEIRLKANGFEGSADGYTIGSVFSEAFEELSAKILEGTAPDRA